MSSLDKCSCLTAVSALTELTVFFFKYNGKHFEMILLFELLTKVKFP